MNNLTGDVRAAIAGDTAAFARIVEAHEGMLYRVCRTILKSQADCADAVQETVITAWRRIGQLRNTASFPAWLAKICINRCYRIARRQKSADMPGEPEGAAFHNDTRLDVMSAVHALPEELRLTVVFYYFEDWSIDETARALGAFPGTVKSRLHRARQLLAAALSNYKEGICDDAQ